MIKFKSAETKQEYGYCIFVRTSVFGVEQMVDCRLEIDEFEENSHHILGCDGDRPCAVARWRTYGDDVAKIERVAILKEWRGKKLGALLMQATIDDIAQKFSSCRKLRLGAQDYAIPFYEKLGFTVVGKGFMDADIPHHMMEKSVTLPA